MAYYLGNECGAQLGIHTLMHGVYLRQLQVSLRDHDTSYNMLGGIVYRRCADTVFPDNDAGLKSVIVTHVIGETL